MNDTDLKLGDIIFFLDSRGIAEHVGLFAGRKDGAPIMVHVVADEHNCVMKTTLKPADGMFVCAYEVYRYNDALTSAFAATFMRKWDATQVPYASTKKRDALDRELDEHFPTLETDKDAPQKLMEYAARTFNESISHLVDIANHISLPILPEDKDPESIYEGMTCSESVVTAFNIAAMQQKGVVVEDKDPSAVLRWVWNSFEFPDLADFESPMPLNPLKVKASSLQQWCKLSPLYQRFPTLDILPVTRTPIRKPKEDFLRERQESRSASRNESIREILSLHETRHDSPSASPFEKPIDGVGFGAAGALFSSTPTAFAKVGGLSSKTGPSPSPSPDSFGVLSPSRRMRSHSKLDSDFAGLLISSVPEIAAEPMARAFMPIESPMPSPSPRPSFVEAAGTESPFIADGLRNRFSAFLKNFRQEKEVELPLTEKPVQDRSPGSDTLTP